MKIDIGQARTRAKELVKSGRAAKLADAQREIARELGYPSWPAMIHALEPPTAERVIREADARHDRALELLAKAPALRADRWVALTLGDASGVRDVRRPGGPLGTPPLFYVARSRIAADTVTPARELLERGADPNGPAGEEWTNLSIACSRGDAPLVRLLLEHGAEPNDNDSLYHSVESPDGACTRLLLEHGATVPGTNALWHALDYDRIEPVALLLEHGGDPNEASHWPALHHAVARKRSPEYLRLLVAHGADPTARDHEGRTAYQHAFRRGQAASTAVLLELGAPDDVSDADRALNAVSRGALPTELELDDDIRDVLIELAMRDIDGLRRVVAAVGPDFTASWGGGPRGSLLHQAAWFGRAEFVELLLGAGARPDERADTEYATPLGWAAVGSRYSPSNPDDSFAAKDGDWVGVAQRLVAAGARIEPMFVDMATSPLSDWLAAK
jgi:ankyrin repeat protein